MLNKDPLADALEERLSLVEKLDIKLAPEILHLLLELSDRPVEKSNVRHLDFLKEEVEEGPVLKWNELVDEDPLLREKDVWQNVDFSTESDGDIDDEEDSRSEGSKETDTTVLSSVDADFRIVEDQIVDTIVKEDLKAIKEAQFWRKIPSVGGVELETVKVEITELKAIREILFMLGGLPTSLFEADLDTVRVSRRYVWKHTSQEVFYKTTESFAEYGSALMFLRIWIKRPQSIPLLQVLQNALQSCIKDFDDYLSQCQQRFVAITADVVVSLLAMQAEVASYIRPILRMSEITKKLDAEPYAHAFRYLELLYDETCISQMRGDEETYASIGKLFFECFQVYLRPLRIWMEDGELTKRDNVFFVSEAAGDVDLASLWETRFKLRKTQDGILHAPKFLSAAAGKIFNTGKSVVVLKHLNQFHVLQSARSDYEPTLDFESVCQPSVLHLAPFSQLFDSAFDVWLQSKHQHASYLLRKTLFDSCGLHISLDAFSSIYFLADGIAGSAFTNAIFDKLDTLNTNWNDRFTLTELAYSTFGTIPSVAPERLRTTVLNLARKNQDVAKCRKTVKAIAILELRYYLSWPIQIILTPATINSYKRICTFLFQIRRCSHILCRHNILVDKLTKTHSSDERALYYSLRMRLLWLTQLLYNYLTSLVLEPASRKMRADLKEAEDVDEMITVHAIFIKTALDKALLGTRLELIHKSILKILDLGIKLEDAQASHASVSRETEEQQQKMMDRSLAGLGLHTPRKAKNFLQTSQFRKSARDVKLEESSSEEEDEIEIDVDLSILSSTVDDEENEISYVEKLKGMKADFERLVRFVASGLRGVARAGGGEEGRSWDILAEMIESGLSNGAPQW